MVQFLEALMLVCFGISWPFNIIKSVRSRTAKGKSMFFEPCILVGYFCGVASKFVSGDVTYVVAVYALNIVMVSIDLVLTLRNRKLDKMAEEV